MRGVFKTFQSLFLIALFAFDAGQQYHKFWLVFVELQSALDEHACVGLIFVELELECLFVTVDCFGSHLVHEFFDFGVFGVDGVCLPKEFLGLTVDVERQHQLAF